MYCPQCGAESQASVQYCRVCGTNQFAALTKAKILAGVKPWSGLRRKKTAAERRENHITKGVVSLFSGTGLTIFLYFLSQTLILKLPPHIIAQIPFEVDSVVKVIWLFGLLPVTSGIGNILAGLLIRQDREPPPQLDQVVTPPRELTDRPVTNPIPVSVTDHTTNLLDDRVPTHKKAQTTN